MGYGLTACELVMHRSEAQLETIAESANIVDYSIALIFLNLKLTILLLKGQELLYKLGVERRVMPFPCTTKSA